MATTKDEALKIALSWAGTDIDVHCITDDQEKLKTAYMAPPSCWYILYTKKYPIHLITSSDYIAISKIDGTVIQEGSLNDEG